VTFNNLNDVVGVFHPLRLGFKALVKIKDASNKDKDSSCVWVTKARPMIFHYLSGKGVRVDFYFQHFNEQGLALTSSLRKFVTFILYYSKFAVFLKYTNILFKDTYIG